MESTVKNVEDSPAKKVIPESSITDSATNVIQNASETVILDSPYEGLGCNRCEHIEQEFKVLKGSIKKLIVDIREQMNASENPFINIQQMMPVRTPVFRDDPTDGYLPNADTPEPESPDARAESEVPEKNDHADNPSSRITGNHCPLEARREPAVTRCPLADRSHGRDDFCQIIQLLYEVLDRCNDGFYRECARFGQQQDRNAHRNIRSGCPAGLDFMPPCRRTVDRRQAALYPCQPLPCSPQHEGPQMCRPATYDHRNTSFCKPCCRYSSFDCRYYAGHDWCRPGPAAGCHEYYGPSCYGRGIRHDALSPEYQCEPCRGRPVQRLQAPGPYQYSETPQDYYDEPYNSRDTEMARLRPSQAKARRKSLMREPDDACLPPEPEPVVIDIPTPRSSRGKRKSSPRNVPDMVVVDIEPENVVPHSSRTSRRKGL